MLSLVNLTLAFGGPPLLDSASLDVRMGDRLALIGRNGSGKTSLMKIVTGEYKPDSGERIFENQPKVAVLPQKIPSHPEMKVIQVLEEALINEHLEDWEKAARLDRVLSDLDFGEEMMYDTLSSGQKRRVLLGQSLVLEPDLLLLDEPTNHLDVETIQWMEKILLGFRGAILFVTHDRTFLQNLATAVVDLDRGKLTRWDCDYEAYLVRKEASLEAEAKQNAVFDKKLAQEEVWIRQGIKARRTRNEGRVRHLKKMRLEHSERRQLTGNVQFAATNAPVSGHKVINAEAITAVYDGKELFQPFDCEIVRGDRLGIVGPNGCGKSTLVKMLIGEMEPYKGSVKLGTNLQIAWFDQNREQLNNSVSVFDNIADGSDFITINGEKKHVISHLKDFMFTSEQARGPIHNLSGGERNRLLLARLFTRPFNVLVLDEPTNDLDLETLELLEEQLDSYAGTLILVSHDRSFLDNIVTELCVFEPDGFIRSMVGGYADYLRYRQRVKAPQPKVEKEAPVRVKGNRPDKSRKFLNREQRELDEIPLKIEVLEKEQEKFAENLASPAYLKDNPDYPKKAQTRLDEIDSELSSLFDRWQVLEELKNSLQP